MWLGKSTVVEAGIDWFTTTATDRKTATLLLLRAENLLSQEHRAGCFIKPWRMMGYSGWRCGRLEYGIRDDGAIVRLSSSLAALEWWSVFQLTGRCTRIDLQATLRHDKGAAWAMAAFSRSIKRHYKDRDDGPKITEWKDNNGGRTTYLGSRQSALYFRAYDKGAQSGDENYAGCVRLELEIKNGLCCSVIDSILSYESVPAGVVGILTLFIQKRGGAPLTVNTRHTSLYEVSQRLPDSVQSLTWLNKQVRPSVIRLLEMNLIEETIEALGLTNFVQRKIAGNDNL